MFHRMCSSISMLFLFYTNVYQFFVGNYTTLKHFELNMLDMQTDRCFLKMFKSIGYPNERNFLI